MGWLGTGGRAAKAGPIQRWSVHPSGSESYGPEARNRRGGALRGERPAQRTRRRKACWNQRLAALHPSDLSGDGKETATGRQCPRPMRRGCLMEPELATQQPRRHHPQRKDCMDVTYVNEPAPSCWVPIHPQMCICRADDTHSGAHSRWLSNPTRRLPKGRRIHAVRSVACRCGLLRSKRPRRANIGISNARCAMPRWSSRRRHPSSHGMPGSAVNAEQAA